MIVIDNGLAKNYKRLARAILESALEDADFEFFEDNFDYWKILNEEENKKNKLKPSEIKKAFEFSQIWRSAIISVAELEATKDDIKDEQIKERNLFEHHSVEELEEITGFKRDNILSKARLRGWKVGSKKELSDIFSEFI